MGTVTEADYEDGIAKLAHVRSGVLRILIIVGFLACIIAALIIVLGVGRDVQGLRRTVLYRLWKEQK
jgi:hypothetical protein